MMTRHGFTLLELLFAVAILGILTAVALPSFADWQRNSQLKATARQVYSAFLRARMEAVDGNRVVALRFTAGSGRHGTVQLFADDGRDGGVAGNLILDGGERIYFEMAMPTGLEIRQVTFADRTTGFDPRGLPHWNRWGKVCMTNGTRFHGVILAAAGSVRLPEGGNSCVFH